MKIAIIDADLIGREKHRFPNLVCEKISGYWKERGATVELITNYNAIEWPEWLQRYDEIYVSKVFTDTPINADTYAVVFRCFSPKKGKPILYKRLRQQNYRII